MSSCYHSYKVLLTKNCDPKNFRKLYANMMNLFGRSSSRRRSSEASSSSSSVQRSYVEQSENSIRDDATKSCLWPCNDYMVRVGIKEEFEQYVHNAELGPYIADKCNQHLSSLNHLLKNLNSILVSLECRLNYMTILSLYPYIHFLTTTKFHFGVR